MVSKEPAVCCCFFLKLSRGCFWKAHGSSLKLQGEEALRAAYRPEGLAYFIVRPGGLNNKDGGDCRIVIEQGELSAANQNKHGDLTVCSGSFALRA